MTSSHSPRARVTLVVVWPRRGPPVAPIATPRPLLAPFEERPGRVRASTLGEAYS